MAIKLITGVPGAGKSYYTVYHLLRTYFRFNKDLHEYQLKKDHTIITNIDNLRLPHINLEEAAQKAGKSIEQFFTEPFQQAISKKYKNIIYLLDECQKFFPRRNKINTDTWYYFETHRHFGHDIYLVTQDRNIIAQNLIALVEVEIRAVKRTFSFIGEFKYLVKSEQQILDRFTLKPQKRVFELYKSMDAKESEKIQNPFVKYGIVLGIVTILLFFGLKRVLFYNGHLSLFADKERKENKAQTSTANPHQSVLAAAVSSTAKSANANNELVLCNLSYYIVNNQIYVVCPTDNQIYPCYQCPFTVTIKKRGRFYAVTAQIPANQLPLKKTSDYAAPPGA